MSAFLEQENKESYCRQKVQGNRQKRREGSEAIDKTLSLHSSIDNDIVLSLSKFLQINN
jgi:hypothetical protein